MTFVLQVNGEIMPKPVASAEEAKLILHVNLTCWWSVNINLGTKLGSSYLCIFIFC